jgi:hypothetical protein
MQGKLGYAFSMPKLGATPTKTVRHKFANLLDFRGFRRVLWHRVSPEIALITQKRNTKSGARRRKGPAHRDLSGVGGRIKSRIYISPNIGQREAPFYNA